LINEVTSKGTALHWAAKNGKLEVKKNIKIIFNNIYKNKLTNFRQFKYF
jgi:hypothetical protein